MIKPGFWDEIEAMVSEIERLDKQLGPGCRQAEDREAQDSLARIERRLTAKKLSHVKQSDPP